MLRLRRSVTLRSVALLLSLVVAVSGCRTKWEAVPPPWAASLGEDGPDHVRVLTADGEFEVRHPTIAADTLRGVHADGEGPVRVPVETISMVQSRGRDAGPVVLYVLAGVVLAGMIAWMAAYASSEEPVR